MKKILFVIYALFFHCQESFAYPTPNAFPPFKIAQNLYYVGTDDLASYLIVTPKGNILINSNLNATVPMIKKSIEQLGFKWTDTKILLISHAHLDHAAGSAQIIRETKAKYLVMDADVSLVQSGGKSDFHYGGDDSMFFSPSTVDTILHDGDEVQLGGTILTAHLTPGHTKGCTTWTMDVNEHGKRYGVVILGSLNVNSGYQLFQNKNYQTMASDYGNAIKMAKSLRCDIFLGAHASSFDLKKKYDLLKKNSENPFIDPAGCQKHIAQKEIEYRSEMKKQKTVKQTVLN